MVEALKKYDQILVEHQIKKLQIYSERVVKWNQYINLTGAKDSTIFFEQHVLDCLSVVPFFKKKRSVIDVGSGCGLPGLILAIALPETRVFAVEPLSKRYRFLNQIRIELDIRNFSPINKRIQELSWSDTVFRDFSEFTLVSRAFGEIESFVDASSAFIDYGAEVYLMRSQLTDRELNYLDYYEYSHIHNIKNSSFDRRILVNFKRRYK
ncbi:MAG: 16S rRNA (guanine(527)-N(7))-methyltransferase RsmG [Pseudomonadota bacterium]|jgi:16S rRNA (guanine527-N7)-methyltransferase|nr:16S rRNA (guanine(527)-N(7))-methyltransferase RsmG [Pseudomonadota bacterium]